MWSLHMHLRWVWPQGVKNSKILRDRGSLSIVKGAGEGGGSKRQRRVRWESYRLIRRENHGSKSSEPLSKQFRVSKESLSVLIAAEKYHFSNYFTKT